MAKKWIQKAIKKPGALRETLGVKEGEKIPAKKLASAEAGKYGPKAEKRAHLARTLRSFDEGGYVTETGPALLHEGEVVIRSKGVPAAKMSKSYDEYWHEVKPSGASNAGTEQFSGAKTATHGHSYPGRPYPEKGTKTGYPVQDTGKVVPKLDMETVKEIPQEVG